MKENKLGRKFANTWSPPRNRFATRMANKGVRKNARLSINEEFITLLDNGDFFQGRELIEQIGGTKRGLWLEDLED